jgi:hypothetical protein
MASVRRIFVSPLRSALIALGLLASVAPALAQSLMSPEPLAGIVDEIRIGIHAHDVHHAMLPFLVQEWEVDQIDDISFDVLFTSPDVDAFRWIGSPRPEVGVTINTDNRDSLAHLGLTWQLPVFETPFYLEGTFGAAIHNGYLTNSPDNTRRHNFGCRVNFYERFGVGANLSESMTATVTYEHTSNAQLCDDNQGLSNFGVRLGWKF